MAAVPTLKQQLISYHTELITQLEDKYIDIISKLLQQKKAIILKIQNELYQHLQRINNLTNKPVICDTNGVQTSCTGNELLWEQNTASSNDSNENEENSNSNDCTDNTLKAEFDEESESESEPESHCGPIFSLNESNQSNHNNKNISFKCNYCDKQFKQISGLTQHVRTHTGERPFECSYCGKAFKQQTTLKNHLRIHTGEKPYKCDECGKRFTQRGVLINHRCTQNVEKMNAAISDLEKPYKCNYPDCKYRTKWRNGLIIHIRGHTGECPYVCDYCNKGCKSKSELTIHERKHTGYKPYKCQLCNKSFAQSSRLKSHIKSIH